MVKLKEMLVCRSGFDCESYDGCASTATRNPVAADVFSCALSVYDLPAGSAICDPHTTQVGASKPLSCLVDLGVGGASTKQSTLVLAGAAGLVGGALSMAVGEYISVSSQRDAERADIQRERDEQAKGADKNSKSVIN